MTNQIGTNEYIHGRSDAVTKAMARRSATKEGGFFLPFLQPGMDLLDGGCGPGTITKGFAEKIAPGIITGLDISEAQLEVASVMSHK